MGWQFAVIGALAGAVALGLELMRPDDAPLESAAIGLGVAISLFGVFPALRVLKVRKHLASWGLHLTALVLLAVVFAEGDHLSRVLPGIAIVATGLLGLAQLRGGRMLLRLSFYALGLFLTVSGLALPFSSLSLAWMDLKSWHGLLGLVWAPLFFAYVVDHGTQYDSASQDRIRRRGQLSAVLLNVCVLTGVTHLFLGNDTWVGATEIHVIAGGLGLWVMVAHLYRWGPATWRRMRAEGASRPFGRVVATIGPILLAVALPFIPGVNPGSGELEWTADVANERLANPRTGITAASTSGVGIEERLLSAYERGGACSGAGGCHQAVHEQWERSGHRFAANPAYLAVVRTLAEEEGNAATRLCAGCHDPGTLLAGQILPEVDYPNPNSEGVTCVVCHGMVSHELGGGRYRVDPGTADQLSRRLPIVEYMHVRDGLEDHRDVWSRPGLRDSETCAACHNLTLGSLDLRDTHKSWKASGTDRSCSSCHMPRVDTNDIGGKVLASHEFIGGNVALPRLYGQSPDAQVAFIAQALQLDAKRQRGQVSATLRLVDGGHSFPSAPRDLVDYWFEAGAPNGAWTRVGPTTLFAEVLRDASGNEITGHRIWKAVSHDGAGEIEPGGERRWSLAVPPQATHVRLMHRRYRDEVVRRAVADTLFVDPVEILVAPIRR